ncbi:2-keto-4-pentenoate hydratase [Pararoseomonas indoligenes]|uniref:Fumarylacetoacetate hydrolase family protein n=1 Tax=Roseomonas indoligenes TaxID=2820811 RepID=A0A940N1N0_9PROT|nr:fumarylacetoacetate hydrolase family protein [Pararoseomonas indoligenes]MBP0496311.1 fumarylacetoacetate hydrolase family protein [Pararoseomonas indoligenes]
MPEEWFGRLDLSSAYAVQLAFLDRYIAEGEFQAGWKVGLTAPAMRAQQGVHEPCFGFLLGSGHRETGAAYRFDDLISPGFENELCLTIGSTLRGPGVTVEEVAAAVTHAAPALEIVEKRGNFAADLPLAMADNAQQKGFVTGKAVALRPENRDLAGARVRILINGAQREEASGAEVMGGGALLSIVWLANKLAEFGRSLEAGMLVMSGSFTKQYALARGDVIEASFEPFGSVHARFE